MSSNQPPPCSFSPLPGFMGSEGATAAGASGATLPLLARHSPCLTHSRTGFAPRQPLTRPESPAPAPPLL